MNIENITISKYLKIFNRIVMKKFTESDWIHIGNETNCLDKVQSSPRLLRSLGWGDDDYAKHATQMIYYILIGEENRLTYIEDVFNENNLIEFLKMNTVKQYLKEEHKEKYNEIYELENQHVQIPEYLRQETANEIIQRTLKDVDVLIKECGPANAVDRMHTMLHAYLKEICDKNNIDYKKTDSLTAIWSKIRKIDKISKSELISNIIMGFATVIQQVNESRNNQSLVHANKNLLSENEAWLVINAVRTIYSYISKCNF